MIPNELSNTTAAAYANHRLRKIRRVQAVLQDAKFGCHGSVYMIYVDSKPMAFAWQMAHETLRVHQADLLRAGTVNAVYRHVQAKLLVAVRHVAKALVAEAEADTKRYGRPVHFAFLTKDVLDFDSDTELGSRDWLGQLSMYYAIAPSPEDNKP